MKRITMLLLLLLSIGLPMHVLAATTQISCSSSSTVQTAINSSSNGDIIQCTGGGWGSGTVTINKAITLDGQGASVGGSISITASSAGVVRVTNFTFTRSGADTLQASTNKSNEPFRVDHCNFTGAAHFEIEVWGFGPGLFDNNTFHSPGGALEYFHIYGVGPDDSSGWTDSITPGTATQIYFEDNDFLGTSGDTWLDTYYGARWTVRYNNFVNWNPEAHGNVRYSGRWWEIYKNNFSSGFICMRGGSGVIFGNTGSSETRFVEESNNCSAGQNNCDEIGKGQNWVQWPMYYWGNSFGMTLNQTGCAPAISGAIVNNLDVFNLASYQGTSLPPTCSTGQGYWKTDEGGNWDTTNGTANDGMLYKCTSTNTWTTYYTPYTYPHPVRNSGPIAGDPPLPPLRLNIVGVN